LSSDESNLDGEYPVVEPRAVILLSGGLDSATTLAVARDGGFRCCALTFAYGQRHEREIGAARRVADSIGVAEHRIIAIDLAAFGGSALTDSTIDVPKDRADLEHSKEIPLTYVPARNTIFLSYAMAYAEVLGAENIFIGASSVDYSGYPDCRPEYFQAFNSMAKLATGVKIHTPLIHLSKTETIEIGEKLGVDYSLTFSCYNPSPAAEPCGKCDSCVLREKGFAKLNSLSKTPATLG